MSRPKRKLKIRLPSGEKKEFNLKEIDMWKLHNFSSDEMSSWKQNQFSIDEAKLWRSHSFNANQASRWRQQRLSLENIPKKLQEMMDDFLSEHQDTPFLYYIGDYDIEEGFDMSTIKDLFHGEFLNILHEFKKYHDKIINEDQMYKVYIDARHDIMLENFKNELEEMLEYDSTVEKKRSIKLKSNE